MAGALLGGICATLSAYAQNVMTLIFTIGVGTGFGFGLIYLPAIVSVTVWFERRRSLATGKKTLIIPYAAICDRYTFLKVLDLNEILKPRLLLK